MFNKRGGKLTLTLHVSFMATVFTLDCFECFCAKDLAECKLRNHLNLTCYSYIGTWGPSYIVIQL